MRIQKLLILSVVLGLFLPCAKAHEKGLPLYTMQDRDLALVLSDVIQNKNAEPIQMKRVLLREVTAVTNARAEEILDVTSTSGNKFNGKMVNPTLFEVKRGAQLADKAKKTNPIVALSLVENEKD